MEANDSEGTNPTSYDDPASSRYSKRVRKPIQIYLPETGHSKPKKHDFDVKCEVLKSKGFSSFPKHLNFSLGANLSALNVVKKFLRKARCEMPDCKFVFYCEKMKTWKRLKNSDQLAVGNTYKIRAYKVKKMEKLERNQIKRTEKKMAEAPKPVARVGQMPGEINPQTMMIYNMYYMMMCNQALSTMFNYYQPFS